MKILRLVLILALGALWSCANVSPDGAGGSGGTGGTGGMGGMGGTGAVSTLERNTEPVPDPPGEPEFAAEPTDEVIQLVASGSIIGSCDGDGVCVGADPVDQFILRAGQAGTYTIGLSWSASGGSDIDLYFLNSTGTIVITESIQEGTLPESVSPTLTAGDTYVIHVQAFDTFGFTQDYTLQVTAP